MKVTVKNVSNGPVLVGDTYLMPGETREEHAHVVKAATMRHPHRLAVVGGESSDDNNQLSPDGDILNPAGDDLTKIKGVGERTAELLREAGYTTIQAVAEADVEDLAAINGGHEHKASKWIAAAQELLDSAVS